MHEPVTEQTILDALHQLARERWDSVLTFIESLQPTGSEARELEASLRPLTATDLLASGLVGLRAERADIGDSREFARRLRERAQVRIQIRT